jgi:perosamine synthetase
MIKVLKIPFFKTYINKSCEDIVNSTLKSNFLNEGSIVDKFEDRIRKFLNVKYINTTNSGTSALHLSLIASGVGPGDEVILSPQTFVATGLAVKYCGAKPVFCDIQIDTGNICSKSIEKKLSKKTKAIIVVHWSGYPCDLDEIRKVVKKSKKKIYIIEDAAHAFGAEYKKKKIGTISDFTCFSFQSTKHLTCGDGGAVACLNKDHNEKIKRLKWFGIHRDNDKPGFLGERIYNLKFIGFKYHMNNFAASLGMENIKMMKSVLRYHHRIGMLYFKHLKAIKGIKLMNYDPKNKHSYWFFQLLVKNRNDFIKKIRSLNIPCGVVNQRIDKNKIFKKINDKNINYFSKHQIGLPVHTGISEKHIIRIAKILKKN